VTRVGLEVLFQCTVSGLAIGSIYALIAVGYAMIWKAMGVLNFSQGQVFMLGGFFGLTALRLMGSPTTGSLPVIAGLMVFVAGLAIALAVFVQTFVFAPLQRRTPVERFKVNMLVSTMAVGIVLENAARLIWTSEPVFFPRIFGTRVFLLGDIAIPEHYVRIIGLAVVLVIILQLVLFRTRMGQARERESCFALITNLMDADKYPASNILGEYKQQSRVEARFSFLKSPYLLGQVFLKKQSRIEALGYVPADGVVHSHSTGKESAQQP
jgi:branched-chain amino acid transport system permease protein